MSWIWAKIITGIIFVLIPGFTLKENFEKHRYLTIISISLGLFILFLSLKSLVEADNSLDNVEKHLSEIRESMAKRERLAEDKLLAIEKVEKDKLVEKERLAREKMLEDELEKMIKDELKEFFAPVCNTMRYCESGLFNPIIP